MEFNYARKRPCLQEALRPCMVNFLTSNCELSKLSNHNFFLLKEILTQLLSHVMSRPHLNFQIVLLRILLETLKPTHTIHTLLTRVQQLVGTLDTVTFMNAMQGRFTQPSLHRELYWYDVCTMVRVAGLHHQGMHHCEWLQGRASICILSHPYAINV